MMLKCALYVLITAFPLSYQLNDSEHPAKQFEEFSSLDCRVNRNQLFVVSKNKGYYGFECEPASSANDDEEKKLPSFKYCIVYVNDKSLAYFTTDILLNEVENDNQYKGPDFGDKDYLAYQTCESVHQQIQQKKKAFSELFTTNIDATKKSWGVFANETSMNVSYCEKDRCKNLNDQRADWTEFVKSSHCGDQGQQYFVRDEASIYNCPTSKEGEAKPRYLGCLIPPEDEKTLVYFSGNLDKHYNYAKYFDYVSGDYTFDRETTNLDELNAELCQELRTKRVDLIAINNVTKFHKLHENKVDRNMGIGIYTR